jgi:hypothetical protein
LAPSIGTPVFTAIRTAADSSARLVLIVTAFK